MSQSEAEKKDKPAKIESVAEETGELIGMGLRKTWNVAKGFTEGLVDAMQGKDEEGKGLSSTVCQHCESSIPPNSNFCPHCGKKATS